MKEALVTYFAAEKRGAMILVLMGVLALGVAAAVTLTRSNYRSMAIPLALLALVELAIGIGVYARTDGQVAGLLTTLGTSPVEAARGEITRMNGVMRAFAVVEIVEIVVFAAGVVLAMTARASDVRFAVGLGCIMQASALLCFDLFAERRAVPYMEALQGTFGAGVAPAGTGEDASR